MCDNLNLTIYETVSPLTYGPCEFQIRIVQDLGLISATGTAAAPTNPSQCGPQAEAALQTAMQELSTRAFTRGANAVFQTS